MAKVMFEFKDGGNPERAAEDLGLVIERDTLFRIQRGDDQDKQRQPEKRENVGVIVGLPGMTGVKVIRLSENFPDILSKARDLNYLSEFSVRI